MKTNLKKQILEDLSKVPMVGAACNNAGISRQTFYRWMKRFPKFKSEVEESMLIGNQNMCDMAESVIINSLKDDENSFKAAKFILERTSEKYKRSNTVNNVFINTSTELSLEEAIKIAEQNLVRSVASGNIEDSKYMLEHNLAKYKTLPQYRKSILEKNISEEKEGDGAKHLETIKSALIRFASSRGEKYEDDSIKPLQDESQTPFQQSEGSEAETREKL